MPNPVVRGGLPIRPAVVAAFFAAISSVVSAQPAVASRPASDSPTPSYSEAVEVRGGGLATLYVSALVPEPVDPSAVKDSPDAFGDTRAQTEGILRRLKALLERRGYTLRDVVKVNVFLVGDASRGGTVDNTGFGAGYDAFFGASAGASPPARTRATVAALTNPLWRVAIDAIAAKASP